MKFKKNTSQLMYVKPNNKVRSRNHCCRGKAECITYSECVFVAFTIHQAKRMRRIILWSVAFLIVPRSSTLFHNGMILERNYSTWNVLKFSSQILSETFLITRRIQWPIVCVGLHLNYPIFSLDFVETWTLSTEIRKILKYQISCKSAQWEANCLMPSDKQTDLPKL